MDLIARVFGGAVLVVIMAAIFGGFFYGWYRIIRRKDWQRVWPMVGLWLIGFGWAYGLWYVLGPDRRYRQDMRAAERGGDYHPDYKQRGG